ncbi:MAG: phasin family protein [Alphaproteobacteria bacterium]|nr:phasin family protein [Alphaproteobacteria bacterium]
MSSKTKAAFAAEDLGKPVDTGIVAGKEMMDTFVKVGQEAAQKGYEQAMTMTKEQVEKARVAVAKGYDELNAIGKDNVDALVKASTICAKGFEAIGKEVVNYTQARVESNLAAMKALMGARTLKEFVDLQTEFARSSFDQLVTESTKLSEIGVKVANDAFAPLNARVNTVVEKLTKPAAA